MNLKKLLSAVGLLTVAAPAALSVAACGPTNDSSAKTDLKNVEFKAIAGIENDTVEVAFTRVLAANPKFTENDLEVNPETFKAANYNEDGAIEVKAKENSKYEGSATVTITKLAKLNLEDELEVKEIAGLESDTEENVADVFKRVLAANPKFTENDITFNPVTFWAPSYTANGWIDIKPQEESKYEGNVKVIITKLAQLNLKDELKFNEINGNEVNEQQSVFWKVIILNQNISKLDMKVADGSFIPATYDQDGSITIIPRSTKYTGEAVVTITKLKNLSEQEIVDIIQSKPEEGSSATSWNMDMVDSAISGLPSRHWVSINGFKPESCKLVQPPQLLINGEERELTAADLNKALITTVKLYFDYGAIQNWSITYHFEIYEI